jgi:thiopeptide-type bacteriocin biosynthesis protein
MTAIPPAGRCECAECPDLRTADEDISSGETVAAFEQSAGPYEARDLHISSDCQWGEVVNPSPGNGKVFKVPCGNHQFSVLEFLKACAQSLEHGNEAPSNPELIAARDVFLSAGLPAVRLLTAPSCWIHIGLGFAHGQQSAVYTEVLETARGLLDQTAVSNFFFMHKPPGLRIRFETPGWNKAEVERELSVRISSWISRGLITTANPAVYEPESHLFGGPVSMASVHRLFTADSLAWLGYHRLVAANNTPGPNWVFSLALLNSLFAALHIVDWEDRDVWDRVRRQAGRRLSPTSLGVEGFAEARDGIHRTWRDKDSLYSQLSRPAATLVRKYDASAIAEGERWNAEYFTTSAAYVGPREAAAYYVVYHWNRGAMHSVRQALLAECLAEGSAV